MGEFLDYQLLKSSRGNSKAETVTRIMQTALIRWQNAKCATSGFIAGLGGSITLPVSIPANISSVLYIQIRMIAAIAYMGGTTSPLSE